MIQKVLGKIAHHVEEKENIFFIFFKTFLNKYFLPAVQKLEEGFTFPDGLSSDAQKTGGKSGKGKSKENKIDKLAKEVRYFFSFLGTLAVEYYCLDSLSFSARNDMGFDVKVDYCIYLNDCILSDFFMYSFFEKYLSPHFIELYQRRYFQELAVFSSRISHLQKSLTSKCLSLPFEVFPDYGHLTTIMRSRFTNLKFENDSENNLTRETEEKIQIQEFSLMKVFNEAPSHRSVNSSKSADLKEPKDCSLVSKNSVGSGVENVENSQRTLRNGSASSEPGSGLLRFKSNFKTNNNDSSSSREQVQDPNLYNTVLSDSDLLKSEESIKRAKRHSSLERKNKGKNEAENSKDSLRYVSRLSKEAATMIFDILKNRPDSVPFSAAIYELKKIKYLENPLDKLRCICQSLSTALTEVREYTSMLSGDSQCSFYMTVDNLQSILTFIVVKGGVSSLISHIKIVQGLFLSTSIVQTDRLYYLLEGVLRFVAESL